MGRQEHKIGGTQNMVAPERHREVPGLRFRWDQRHGHSGCPLPHLILPLCPECALQAAFSSHLWFATPQGFRPEIPGLVFRRKRLRFSAQASCPRARRKESSHHILPQSCGWLATDTFPAAAPFKAALRRRPCSWARVGAHRQ